METPSKFELYNSQSTAYLKGTKEALEEETPLTGVVKEVRNIIAYIIEARESWEEARPCLWVCGWECKENCKNLT